MIQFSQVSKVFPGPNTAVDAVSFEIPTGSIACLIGTSGCGKTTTLKLINRLINPSSGVVEVNGQDNQRYDETELRRSIGYVIQRGGLMPHMTVLDNIMLLETVKGTAKAKRTARAEELLHLMGLDPRQYGERYPRALSGGQQQRVGIARALMSDPPILLMDEPFGALDPIVRHRLQQEMWTLNQTLHKTIVLVTHDLPEAFLMGDLIILMNKGRIEQQGNKDDFLLRPATSFVSRYMEPYLQALKTTMVS